MESGSSKKKGSSKSPTPRRKNTVHSVKKGMDTTKFNFLQKKQVLEEDDSLKSKVKESPKIILKFMFKDGQNKDHIVEDRLIKSYTDLQLEICRFYPTNQSLFMIHNSSGDVLRPDNFDSLQEYRIREISSNRMEKQRFYPKASPYWEFKEYHGKPKGWRDVYAEKVLAKKREKALQASARSNTEDDAMVDESQEMWDKLPG